MAPNARQIPTASIPVDVNEAVEPEDVPWWVYMVRCGDGSLYTGATIDPVARAYTHQRGKGARYTKYRGVSAIAFCAWMPNKRAALSAEAYIKRWPTADKRALADAFSPVPLVDA